MRGFSLIELTITLAISAILVSVSVPLVVQGTKGAQLEGVVDEFGSLAAAAQNFYMDKGYWPGEEPPTGGFTQSAEEDLSDYLAPEFDFLDRWGAPYIFSLATQAVHEDQEETAFRIGLPTKIQSDADLVTEFSRRIAGMRQDDEGAYLELKPVGLKMLEASWPTREHWQISRITSEAHYDSYYATGTYLEELEWCEGTPGATYQFNLHGYAVDPQTNGWINGAWQPHLRDSSGQFLTGVSPSDFSSINNPDGRPRLAATLNYTLPDDWTPGACIRMYIDQRSNGQRSAADYVVVIRMS